MAPSLNSDPSVARSSVSTRIVGQISGMCVISFHKSLDMIRNALCKSKKYSYVQLRRRVAPCNKLEQS
jgi:hypothetical protein